MRVFKRWLMPVAFFLACVLLLGFTLNLYDGIKKKEMIPNPDNLLGIGKVDMFRSITKNGVTFTRNEDGSYHVYGTATESFSLDLTIDGFHLEQGKTYMFSSGMKNHGSTSYFMSVDCGNTKYLGDLETSFVNSNGIVFGAFSCENASAKYKIRFYFIYKGGVIDEVIYPVLVEGTQPGEFYIEK